MAPRETLVRPVLMRRALNNILLGSVSLLALMAVSDLGEARSLTPGANTVAPTAAAVQAGLAAAQQAAGAAAQAQESLARAAAALNAARNLQLDAAAAARAAQSSVPNGVTAGGLMQLNPAGSSTSTVSCGVSCTRTTTTWQTDSSWTGANGPVETVQSNSPKVTVDIQQTQSKAILNWKTFNVGADTTVNFKQGASDWIALNRVDPASGSPTRILGQVNAPGAVYLINRNGIIFGAGSQVNVHTLIASSLDIGKLGTDQAERDRFFLNTGIAELNSFSIYDAAGGKTTKIVAGDITVERGASIKAGIATDQVPLGSPGSVYLFGANVSNSGSITVPTGEVAMVAARSIDLVPYGFSSLPENVLGKDSSGALVKFRGAEFRVSHFDSNYDSTDPDTNGYGQTGRYLAGTGAVRHDGLIDASQGIVVMTGDRISVDNPTDATGGALKDAAGNLVQGVISVDTSIGRNSMVLLRGATSVAMNGVISSLPVDDGSQPLASGPSSSSTVAKFTPAYIELSAQSTVAVGASGLISAPSAQVTLRAINLGQTSSGVYQNPLVRLFNQGADAVDSGQRNVGTNTPGAPQTVLLAPGAVVDVAGLANVSLPASYNYIAFKPLAEYADMPLQRSPYEATLYGSTFYIDIRASGTRADGTKWVGTPLADASGYLSNVGRSIYQLMTVGGSVTLKTDLIDAKAGVQTAGSIVNVAGGGVKFESGMVNATRLIGADGRIYSMANADPNMTYLGIAGQFTRNHSRWGVTETWSTGTQIYSPGYSEGYDAGSVIVSTVNPLLTGTMYFGSVAGERQINSGQLPLQGTLDLTTPSSVQIGGAASANYTSQSAVTTNLSADALSGYGLSQLAITANDVVVSSGSALNLAAGGTFSVLAGGAIDIAGSVAAAGGSIDLKTDRTKFVNVPLFKAPNDQSGAVIAANVFVAGTLDVSGRFVNDTGRTTTDMSGPAFIDGGTISITTNKDSTPAGNNNYADATGSILLAKGSVLDVSSGGYISPQGKAKTVSTGLMAGKAGSIALALYQGPTWDPQLGPHAPTQGSAAVLQLDGKLLGYGFESNGSLRLAGVDTIRIGGALKSGETSSIRIGGVPSTLPTSLLTGGGFGSYAIESLSDNWSGAAANIIVSSGTSLSLQQQNLSSLAYYGSTATGTRLGQQGAPLALLPDDQRKPVDLTLKADNIKLDTGASIVTDPKAKITFAAVSEANRNLAATDPLRTVQAQNVELLGSIVDHGGTVFINALKTHLGAKAVVDLSGAFVANSMFGLTNKAAISGTYVAGGTFAVEAGSAVETGGGNYAYGAPSSLNYLVSDAGAKVDISGAAGFVQVAGARGATSSLWSWSDAGTVNVDVSRFAWGGSFAAAGGRYVAADGTTQVDARANGGTLRLGGGVIQLRQDTTDVNAAVAAFKQGAGAAPSSLLVAADQLSQFDNVYLYAASGTGGAARFFNDVPGTIYGNAYSAPSYSFLSITGPLDWTVTNRLEIAAGVIQAPTSSVDANISASYVLLTGGGLPTATGGSTLTVGGKTIDVEGATFSGFSKVSLLSGGDIRLSTPKVVNGIVPAGATQPSDPATFTGKMSSFGDLLLSAQRIYPVSAVNFTIQTPGKVTFAAPAGSKTRTPLSAGGGLNVHATTIEQGGNLFAPLGKIALGNTDTAVSPIVTQSVSLLPGSLTSVTLADTTVPYGATLDGSGWYYNSSTNPLAQPSSKGIVLAGKNVERQDGSTIDLRGGGDLQAMEWIQGKGGSRDTLTTTPLGQTVYALLPSGDAVAAFDIHMTAATSADLGKTVTAGDTYPLAGTQITIDGGNGIPAGTYTLYPAHYATLPGAMRVVYYGDNTGVNRPTTTLPDGTVLVRGHYTQSTMPGKQSSGQSMFAVQTNSVWRQYSEYSFNRANSYFTSLAAKNGTTVPRLPMDAGRLAVLAQQTILLKGIALTQPGQDDKGNLGRGGELDISAPKLAVLGHAGYLNNETPASYVGLDASELNGFESILIGGLRSDTTKGTLITPTASSVLVDTNGETLSAPEILLVAGVPTSSQPQTIPQTLTVNGQTVVVENQIDAPGPDSGTVRIATGSVIKTTGIVHAGAGRSYYFADPANGTPTTAQQIAAALGGTLDPSGTVITGVDISKFDYFVKNADGSFVLNPDGSVYRNIGTVGDLLRNYANQTKGLGALFVATNDSSLKVSGPSGVAPPSLSIQFASSTDPKVPGAVNGSLLLPADAGRLVIESGASVTAKSATMQATASTNAIVGNSSDIHLQQLNVTARTIALGSPTLVGDKSVALYNQQFADVKELSLKALSGDITLYGDYNPGAVSKLTLDAARIVRADNGGSAKISANGSDSSITLVNTGAAGGSTVAPATGGYKLGFDASEIVLGGGAQTMLGYGEVFMTAANRVFVAASGSLTLGGSNDAVDLNLATRNVLVAGATSKGSGSFAVTTRGHIVLSDILQRDPPLARPADSAETGGKLSLTGADVVIGSMIQAQAGTIALEATAGDVWLAPRAYLAAGGYKKTLVDVDTYLSGGKVVLKSDKGNVYTDALSVIDVAQPAGGLGYGGTIEVTALGDPASTFGGNATLNGALRGAGGPGLGGRFKLDIKGKADLTALADRLLDGGVTGAIDIHTRTGNLELLQDHTLKAHDITLTADDPSWSSDPSRQSGQIKIRGRIDATGYGGYSLDGNGQAGGKVSLYGANAVLLASSGVIDASTAHADERGGDVTVGISWAAKSKIFLQLGTQINVSGGTKGGLSGGTVTFRAPLDGNNDVKIVALSNTTNPNGPNGLNYYADGDKTYNELPVLDATNNVNDRSRTSIVGARAVAVNGFVAFDTQAGTHGIDGSSLGWFGTIDTAGWYKGVDQNGNLIPATEGTWTNVSGWKISSITGATGGFASAPSPAFVTNTSGAIAATVNFVMGIETFVPKQITEFNQLTPGQTNIPVTFPDPQTPGGVRAQGFASVDASGTVSITITNPGTGYTTRVATVKIAGVMSQGNEVDVPYALQFNIIPRSTLKIISAQLSLPSGSTGFDGTSLVSVSSGTATVNFEKLTDLSGTTKLINGTPQFVPDTADYIPATSSGVFAFDPANQGKDGVASFTGGAGTGHAFFGDTISQITQGRWTNNGQSYGFSNLFTRLDPLVQSLGAGVVHVQPGVELVNSKGDITVSSNWNLAAGTAGGLVSYAGKSYYDPNSSYISFNYRLATPWGGVDAGALTLRAAGNINVNASISDGFFQFGDYQDPSYISKLGATARTIDAKGGAPYTYYLSDYTGGPIAPYKDAANSVSPTTEDLANADLFPHALRVCVADCNTSSPVIRLVTSPSSWSYRLTAGADFASANPSAVLPTKAADVIVDKHATYKQSLIATNGTSVSVNLPTMVRTGTGNIDISAAQDVILKDTAAPGVIYAAGVNTARLTDPNYHLANGSVVPDTDKVNGFFEPRVLGYSASSTFLNEGLYYGPPTAAAFPEMGGDVVINAQRDIKGHSATDNKVLQYYQPWLLSLAEVTPDANLTPLGAGIFAPAGTQIASQSAWWIQYGSFQQGFLSAGGNASVIAGRDLIDVSVSLPTTGRVSGGLAAGSTPVAHLYGSGNMVVRAGGDIRGGSFYEGSGSATITAGGDIGQNGTVSRYKTSELLLPDVPVLAVDTGKIAMTANGAITIAGVVNPAALHAQQPSRANPLDTLSPPATPLYMDTYGPDSKVSLVAQAGDLTITVAPPTISDSSLGTSKVLGAASSAYPASFDARALDGNLITTGIAKIIRSDPATQLTGSNVPMPGVVLSPSENGTFNLLAQGSIDLTFGYPTTSTTLLPGTPRPFISAGPSLIDVAFDPFRPNSGNNDPSSRAILAHENDVAVGLDTTARIYAATGDITATGGYGRRTSSSTENVYQRIEINRPAKVYAGRDLIDLNIIVQNIHTSDVSTIAAGRNITYTGYSNGGGLQVAGPGFLVVQAGGDIGPFLPAAHNNADEAKVQEGIISVGNSSPTAVGNFYVDNSTGGGSIGIYNQALLGTKSNPRRNALLTEAAGTSRGADIITMFGTKFGVDYQAVVNSYVDPANAANVAHNYISELQGFLARVGKPASSNNPEDIFAAFQKLPADLQHVFVDQVFFAELKAAGVGQLSGETKSQRGYQMVNAMFPASFGYTQNALDGGPGGASQLVKTGDLNLLHGTIQTKLGGDVSIFGPGGNIIVGSLATEPNTALKLPDLGILTLGGGAINTFTDQSVRVNASRVLTSQGGEILMWSSNGDLDAGRGSKTISSAPSLQVLFDQNDYQSIDLSGFVTGSGIQTLRASRVATAANIYLVAPRGVIDAGTAGIGGSGVVVVIAPVIANAGNIQAQGGTIGIPAISVPSIGALTAGSNAAGAAAKSADAPTASGNSKPASIFIVEVIGYGGDGQGNSSDDKQSSGDGKQ
ncbi:filamentous hemagglutinin family protein [Bradyrhizobium sp. USDA 377]